MGKKKFAEGRRDWRVERSRRLTTDSIRRCAHRPPGFHRRSTRRRPRGNAQRGEGTERRSKIIEPLVPVDLVVDHSVQVDFAGSWRAAFEHGDGVQTKPSAINSEWGQQAFKTFGSSFRPTSESCIRSISNISPKALTDQSTINDQPSTIFYPDTLVGTDSTTMINGLGVVGWASAE
jgi:aconitase A